VTGTVIDYIEGIPLVGRSAFIGSASSTTDATGRFTISCAPHTYALVIVDPDRTATSVYLGLTRRDPLVLHRSTEGSSGLTKLATLKGTLSGGPSWPLASGDNAGVLFSSALAASSYPLGGHLGSSFDGPSFGPFYVRWDGSSTLAGQLYAWASYPAIPDAGAVDGGAPAFAYAQQTLTVQDSETPSLGMSLTAVSESVRVTGTIEHSSSSPPTQKEVYYAVPPLPGNGLPLAGDETLASSFDYVVPSLAIPGGSLCFSTFSSTADVSAPLILDTICGVKPDTPVASLLQPPPSLETPANGATVDSATTFTWTNFDSGVFELDLVSGDMPTASAPNVYVYTAARSTTWPNLSAENVPSPSGPYACTLVGLGVFSSIDQLTGPTGFAAAFSLEFRRSSYPAISVDFVP
jgi:hypothetical protein